MNLFCLSKYGGFCFWTDQTHTTFYAATINFLLNLRLYLSRPITRQGKQNAVLIEISGKCKQYCKGLTVKCFAISEITFEKMAWIDKAIYTMKKICANSLLTDIKDYYQLTCCSKTLWQENYFLHHDFCTAWYAFSVIVVISVKICLPWYSSYIRIFHMRTSVNK